MPDADRRSVNSSKTSRPSNGDRPLQRVDPEDELLSRSELALVDPPLAALLRQQLHDPGCFAPAQSEGVVPPAGESSSPAVTGRAGSLPTGLDATRPAYAGTNAAAAKVWLVAAVALAGAAALAITESEVARRSDLALPRPAASTVQVAHRAAAPRAVSAGPDRIRRREVPSTRILAWSPEPGAAQYEVQVFLGSERVFVARTARALLEFRSPWVFRGERHDLREGIYRWYVWPISGEGLVDERPVAHAVMEP
jgi:hypothetical protein